MLLREGLASFLQNTSYKVTACAGRPAELPHTPYPEGQRTLVIVGIDRQNENLDETAESIRLLRSSIPDGKVVLVVEANGPAELQDVLALSPDACIFNLGSRDTLIRVLELTLMDQRVLVFGGSAATHAADSTALINSQNDKINAAKGALSSGSYPIGANSQTPLSPREHQILICVAQGKSNKAIAQLYNLSEATVKVHLKAILRKTKAHNRTQAALWAIKNGLPDHAL
jgi:two-component system nitrate/nitrite response regulator NarL